MVHGVGVLLLSAVAGYWVLERADTHKGELKTIGQVLGAIIVVVSLVGMVCQIWSAAMCSPGGMGKGYCPFSFKSMSPPQ